MDFMLILVLVLLGLLLLSFWGNMLLLMMLMFTPAWIWFKAWIFKLPLFIMHRKDNFLDIKVGRKPQANFSYIKGIGPFELEKGTARLDSKSKVPIYNVLTDNCRTMELSKAAIITELKNAGFLMAKWRHLNLLRKIGSDKQYAIDRYNALQAKSPEKAEAFREFCKKIEVSKIEVKLFKTYNFNELYNLYPDDYNPVAVETSNQLAIQKYKRENKSIGDVLKWALAFIIILLGFGMLYVMLTRNGGGAQEIRLVGAGLANGTRVIVG